MKTTEPGYVNRFGQQVIRCTDQHSPNHHDQFIYELACERCGHAYGVNGCDIFERRCPNCQGGAEGFAIAAL